MPGETKIEWATHVWNPVTGCSKVSPGCAHCYAETFAERWRGIPGHPYEHGFDLTLRPERLDQPLRWRRPRMIFVNSMSDLFHEEIPRRFIRDVFHTMALAPHHTFQVLTKRPERMRDEMLDFGLWSWARRSSTDDEPLSNVWLGVSIENRRFVHRADLLRQTPAAVRFISAEPLLGPLVGAVRMAGGESWGNPLWEDGHLGPELNLAGIDWLIVGGESGPKHRPMRIEWVRDLRDATQRDHNDVLGLTRPHEQFPRWALNGTRFFFKQRGGVRPKAGGRELDGRTWDELPARCEAAIPHTAGVAGPNQKQGR